MIVELLMGVKDENKNKRFSFRNGEKIISNISVPIVEPFPN